MLMRILSDNPGKSFTKNFDAKFASTVKELLRDGRDMSVQQILRETLDNFETDKADDETLEPLRDMWKKEKVKMIKRGDTVAGAGGVGGPLIGTEQPITDSHHSKGCPGILSLPHSTLNTTPTNKTTSPATIAHTDSPHPPN